MKHVLFRTDVRQFYVCDAGDGCHVWSTDREQALVFDTEKLANDARCEGHKEVAKAVPA